MPPWDMKNMNTGTQISPPPMPTSEPKTPTPMPSNKNKMNSKLKTTFCSK